MYVHRNFAFLQAIARDFATKYSARKIRTCNAYALDKDFRPTVRAAMDYYNTNATTLSRDHKISMLMAQVDDLRNILGRNVHLLIERETKIDSLMEKSEQTRIDSLVFKKQSIRMKREQRNKSIKLSILIGGFFFLIFLYFLSMGFKYGWFQISTS